MPKLAASYRAKAAVVAAAINAKFLDSSTGAYAVGGTINHDNAADQRYDPLNASQCGQGMALFMDIVPKELRPKALAVMAANARNTGQCLRLALLLPLPVLLHICRARCPSLQHRPAGRRLRRD